MLVACLIVFFTGISGFVLLWQTNTVVRDPTFPELTIEKQKLEKQRKKQLAKADVKRESKAVSKLLAAVRKLNLGQFPGQDSPTDISASIEYRASDVVVEFGYDGFMGIGQILFTRCHKGLSTLLDAVRNRAVSLDKAQKNPPDSFELYRQYCGRVLPHLLKFGLLKPSGEWSHGEESKLIFDVWQRYRWASLIESMREPYALLTPYEREVLFRWRIERASGFSPESRIDLARRGSQYLPYPTGLAVGIIALKQGDTETAREAFEGLLETNGGKYPVREWLRDLSELTTEQKKGVQH
jgi:hypothetical protein